MFTNIIRTIEVHIHDLMPQIGRFEEVGITGMGPDLVAHGAIVT